MKKRICLILIMIMVAMNLVACQSGEKKNLDSALQIEIEGPVKAVRRINYFAGEDINGYIDYLYDSNDNLLWENSYQYGYSNYEVSYYVCVFKQYNLDGNILKEIKVFVDQDERSVSFSYWIEYTYDDKGNLLSRADYDEQGKKINDSRYEYKYDESGKKVSARTYWDNTEVSAVTYEYDDNDNIVLKITYEDKKLEQLSGKTVYEYHPNGVLKNQTSYIGTEEIGSVKEFDINGNLVQEMDYNGGEWKGCTKYEYNSLNKIILMSDFDEEGNVLRYTEYLYHENGDLDCEVFYSQGEGRVYAVYETEILEDGYNLKKDDLLDMLLFIG